MSFKNDLWVSRKPLAGFVAIGLAWSAYFAQMPVVKQAVGASDGSYGIALLIASSGALAAMALAPLLNRMAAFWALPLGILCVGLGMLFAGVAGGIIALTCAMLIASAGSGVTDVLVNAKISELEEQTGRTLMNLNHALYSFAYAGGALATGVLREAQWQPPCVFTAVFVILIILAWISRGELADISGDDPQIAARVPQRLVWLVGLVVMIAFLAEAASEGWSALHLERTLGGTPAQGALGPALLGLMMGIGRLTGHGLARYIRDTTLMGLATGVSASGILLAALADTVTVALMGFALAGLGISVVAPLALALVGRVVARRDRLAAISHASVMGYGAFFVGPPLMGLVSQGFGLRVAFITVALFLIITVLCVIPLLARAIPR